MILGIDSSKNNTGLVVLGRDGQILDCETVTVAPNQSLIDCKNHMVTAVIDKFKKWGDVGWVGIETEALRTITGPMLMFVRLSLMEAIYDEAVRTNRPLSFTTPLAIQVRSYMKKKTGIMPSNKSDTVALFRSLTGVAKRVSSHIADAYFIAMLTKEILEGTWKITPQRDTMTFHSYPTVCGS